MLPIRLNLGCGLRAPEGWVNIDRSPSILLDRIPGAKTLFLRTKVLTPEQAVVWPRNIRMINVRKGLPYRTGTVETVYSSHMLEHIYFAEAQRLLREIRRVLQPGGILRLALPDVDRWVSDLYEGTPPLEYPNAGQEFIYRLHDYPWDRPSLRQRIKGVFGRAPHYWQPTRSVVKWMLAEAGFSQVTEPAFQMGRCPDLVAVEHRGDSMFIEAEASTR